ncbi:MAG: threonine/serine dehydratase [Promethearchaeota archaeon]
MKTPIMTSTTLDRLTDCRVFLKCENFQKVGAFKFRGSLNAVSQLSEEERKKGVIAHSSGNHAQALALAASMEGIKATIVMPKNSPQVKVNATKGYGAEIVFCKNSSEARVKVARELVEKHGYILIHPYDDERIIAGAGTASLEMIEEIGCLDFVFAPVGGGGLISGTSIAAKGLCPMVRVIAAEPEMADDAYRSFKEGKIFPSVYPDTIADGLRTQLSELTFGIIRRYVDDIITVSEKEIVDAMRFLWERMKIVVEPSGAVSLAGFLKMQQNISKKRIGIILSGGNVDLTDFFAKYEH